jgi:hypothetical protein
MDGGNFSNATAVKNMNSELKKMMGYDSLIYGMFNYQVHINHLLTKKYSVNEDSLKLWIIDYMRKQPLVANVFDLQKTGVQPMNDRLKTVVSNGYYFGRSGDVEVLFKPAIMDHGNTGTTHGSWNPYDSHIPFVLMGWGVKHGQTYRETYMTDIAATITSLLHIQMPNGCVGKAVEEAIR